MRLPKIKYRKISLNIIIEFKFLKSPVNGYIQSVEVATTGGVVSPAQNLVTIVPENMPLLVEATLSNQDIGYVRVGQEVDVKVDTYPFMKYGALKGRLVWISPDAENLANPNAKNPAEMSLGEKLENDKSAVGNTSYRVHIKLDPKSRLVQYPNQATTLKVGMTVQADIKTSNRRIIEFFIEPISKYLDQGLKVR